MIFEGEIASGNVRYEFEVDAATGRFLEWYAKSYNQPVPTASSSTGTVSSAGSTAQSGLIGTSKASEIAVNKAGGGQASVHEVDRDDGRTVYEGTVINGNNRYDFEIDAQTGAILDWSWKAREVPLPVAPPPVDMTTTMIAMTAMMTTVTTATMTAMTTVMTTIMTTMTATMTAMTTVMTTMTATMTAMTTVMTTVMTTMTATTTMTTTMTTKA